MFSRKAQVTVTEGTEKLCHGLGAWGCGIQGFRV